MACLNIDLCRQLDAGDSDQRIEIPFSAISSMQSFLGCDSVRLSRLLAISKHTLEECKEQGQLVAQANERSLFLLRFLCRVIDYFDGNQDKAALWIKTPNQALGGVAPLDRLEGDQEEPLVTNLLGRLEQGIFS
jgi:putative toxin-antitoxin system antitoxin component (TIGR02293 family)